MVMIFSYRTADSRGKCLSHGWLFVKKRLSLSRWLQNSKRHFFKEFSSVAFVKEMMCIDLNEIWKYQVNQISNKFLPKIVWILIRRTLLLFLFKSAPSFKTVLKRTWALIRNFSPKIWAIIQTGHLIESWALDHSFTVVMNFRLIWKFSLMKF